MARGILAWLLLTVLVLPARAEEVVRMVSRSDQNAAYTQAMVRLALDKAGVDYRLEVRPGELSTARVVRDTRQGAIDVMWVATNPRLERHLTPVRIPLFKGMVGFRVMMVHADHRDLFEKVESLDQLRRFTYGLGEDWSDAFIMRDNGFKVREHSYSRLPVMLHGKRFDAFPRAIYEPWEELERWSELDLAVDEHILLVYPMPFYLFVSPQRPKLAEALKRGLFKAVDDGSFDRLFDQADIVRKARQRAGVAARRVFYLDNKRLPDATPLDDERLWLDIDELIGGDEDAGVDQAGRRAE